MQNGEVQRLDELDDDELAPWYDYPLELDRAWVRANFISSLDGAASGGDGLSGSLGTSADRRVFNLLRGQCDVVLVGAGTARAEGYRPARTAGAWRPLRDRLGLAPVPALAVVTRSLDLPASLLEVVEDAGPVLVVTTRRADPDRLHSLRERLGEAAVLQAGDEDVDVGEALEQLAARGLRRVLLEGGPRLMNEVSGAGLLDELCLTLSPVLLGGDGLRIAGGRPLDERLRLAHLLESDSVLLTRWTSV